MTCGDTKTVEKLEDYTEQVAAEFVMRMGLKRLPLQPTQRVMHLMVKAAIAVYEAVAKERQPGPRDNDERRPEL